MKKPVRLETGVNSIIPFTKALLRGASLYVLVAIIAYSDSNTSVVPLGVRLATKAGAWAVLSSRHPNLGRISSRPCSRDPGCSMPMVKRCLVGPVLARAIGILFL